MTAVTSAQRFKRGNPCPVCSGFDELDRGKGERCGGFLSTDGKYAHCTHQGHAGALPIEPNGSTYAHLLTGPCKCGTTHGTRISGGEKIGSSSSNGATGSHREEPARYVYVDESGGPLFRVNIIGHGSAKKIWQEHWDGAGWTKGLNGCRRVLFHLKELHNAHLAKTVHLVEGERDVETLRGRDLIATTSSGGAQSWHLTADHARSELAGRFVLVIADRDDVGRKHAREVAASLRGVAESVAVLECTKGKDVTEHLDNGGTLDVGAIDGLVTMQDTPASPRVDAQQDAPRVDAPRVDLDVPADDARDPDAIGDETFPPPSEPATNPVDFGAPVPGNENNAWEALARGVDARIYSTRPPSRTWLLRDSRHAKAHGVFPLGKVGQLIAEGGAGKTMVECQLAIAVATGTPWLRVFSVPKPGRVLLVLGEEDREECDRRLYHAAQVLRQTPASGSIVVMALSGIPAPMIEADASGNFVDGPFALWIRDYVSREGFSLVIIDPLSRFGGREAETDNFAGTRFIQVLESLVSPTCSVLNAHHTRKASRGGSTVDASSGRGSSALVDGARWQCALTVEALAFDDPDVRSRLGEVVTFAVTKANYAAKPAPVVLRRDLDHGGALVAVDDYDLKLIEAARTASAATSTSTKREARRAEAGAQAVAQDEAVIRAVTESPWLTWQKLCDRVGALADCGERSARKAIERVLGREQIEHKPGPRKATLYALKGASS